MTRRPNIVLVTIDSLRADHCGFMGYEKNTTPTLDAMAETGAVFENAIAPGPATPESMPVVFTGTWPTERGAEPDSELEARRERIRAHMKIRDTIPEKMGRLGYTTGAFTPNPFTSRHFGFDEGFDHFEDFMDESNRGGLYQTVFEGFLDGGRISSMARVLMNLWQREEVFKPWESYYDEVLEWVQNAQEPYFLWVFLMDAHNPYLSSADHRSQTRLEEFHANFEFWRQSHDTEFSEKVHNRLVTAYDDAIRYSDSFVARIRAALDDPTILVHGDHGEAFGEHGTYGHEPYLYPENTHVPLVVSGVPSQQHSRPVSLAALPDLVSALAGRDSLATVSDAYTISATRQGSRRALHTSESDYISAETDTDVTPQAHGSETQREEFQQLAQQLLGRWEQSLAEQRRIDDSMITIPGGRQV